MNIGSLLGAELHRVERTGEDEITLETNSGVGYQVLVAHGAPASQHVRLFCWHVPGDAPALFGFTTPEQREVAKLIQASVDGVGPRIASRVVFTLSLDELRQLVRARAASQLSKRVKGLGAKGAEKLVTELQSWAAQQVGGQAVQAGGPMVVARQTLLGMGIQITPKLERLLETDREAQQMVNDVLAAVRNGQA